jgi:hypothetical protein
VLSLFSQSTRRHVIHILNIIQSIAAFSAGLLYEYSTRDKGRYVQDIFTICSPNVKLNILILGVTIARKMLPFSHMN